jgi:phosphatidylglycerol:prolipoprotein diacylglycerol transferase
MRPTLFQFGNIGVPSYGVMLVISFLVALWLVKHSARKLGIPPGIVEDLTFYVMLGVVIGGRVLYVLFHISQYENDILGILRIWEGGMIFFGGFIGGLLVGIIYLKRVKQPIMLFADMIAPAIALGEFFTRIGCFLNGCCFGKPSNLPWAITFPEGCAASSSPVGDQPLHPTQLYSSLFGLFLFFFLQRRLTRDHGPGEIFSLYLIFMGGFRLGIDFIRYYENTANLMVNQVISLGLIIVGIFILIKNSRRA